MLAFATFSAVGTAACEPPGETDPATITYVIDGDTLVLGGGARLRLIGIDTPELDREGSSDEPFARAARAETQAFLGAAPAPVRLLPGREPRDRHGRLLAHVYDAKGRNLGEHLLRSGLGYQITFPPNDRLSGCYLEAESDARRHRRGLWRAPDRDAAALPAGTEGFERVVGRVERVERGKGVTRIDLDGALTLRIRDEDLDRFDAPALARLVGRRVEVRGWVYSYEGRLRMRLRHPTSLRPL